MPAPVIYYIRHGETSWNAEGRLQGAQDIPLNDLGRRQAAHAGNVLAELFARDGRDKSSLPFVASPLGRARTTMELVRGALKLPPDEYALDDRLREIGYGVWEGSTLAEMQAADPVLLCQAADGEVDDGAGRRRDLRSRAVPDARLVRFPGARTPSRWPMAAPRGR